MEYIEFNANKTEKGRDLMEAAQVKCELNGESLEIQLKGEIDHHTAARIREEIDREVYFYRAPRVIIDLSHIDFMDSSGLGLILGRYTKLKDSLKRLEDRAEYALRSVAFHIL